MRKPITAESLAKSRPHVHHVAQREDISAAGGYLFKSLETCSCGCQRITITTESGCRMPGSWT
jgi:hypothetical protein